MFGTFFFFFSSSVFCALFSHKGMYIVYGTGFTLLLKHI